jgi:hypothetical protein
MNEKLTWNELWIKYKWTKNKLKVRYMDEYSNEWIPWH